MGRKNASVRLNAVHTEGLLQRPSKKQWQPHVLIMHAGRCTNTRAGQGRGSLDNLDAEVGTLRAMGRVQRKELENRHSRQKQTVTLLLPVGGQEGLLRRSRRVVPKCVFA